MSVQEKRQVDNNELFAQIHKLQSDLTAKIDGLSNQFSDLRLLVVQSQSAYDAHDLPSKVDALAARVVKIEMDKAAERDIPGKVEDLNKRLKTIENLEAERVGRRKLLDALAVFGALFGTFLTIVQLYQWLKGR
jgi:hypothetical protein